MNVLKLVVLSMALLGFACGDPPTKKAGTSSAGTLNLPCYPNDTCNPGLVCTEGFCRSVSNPNNPTNNSNNSNNATNNFNNPTNNLNNTTNNQSNNGNPNNPTNQNNPTNNQNNPEPVCGDSYAEGNEACDTSDLRGNTCTSVGFAGGGTLRCQANCAGFDTSSCFRNLCGNGRRDGGEDCDGTDLGAQSCTSLGYDSGTLRCAANCEFDESLCRSNQCGDGVAQGAEQCDGNDLQGLSCQSFGYDGGTLSCGGTCQVDLAGCFNNSSFTCELVQPSGGCNVNDPTSCACMGCLSQCEVTTTAFPPTTEYSDCVCAVCNGNDACNTCNNDGKCDPFYEGCACGDCVDHPLC